MRAGLGLPGSADELIAGYAGRKGFGFFAEAPGFFGKALLKGHGLFETTALLLHDATSGPNRGVGISDS
jgi:hypothetical protein